MYENMFQAVTSVLAQMVMMVKKKISVVVITKKNGRLPDSPSRENLIPVIVSRAIMPKVYTSLFLDGSMK
jgi:hypothetical protein